MDRYISLDDAIEAIGFNPAYTDSLRSCPYFEVDRVNESDITKLQEHRSVDENIIKYGEESGELFKALSKWRDVLNDWQSQPEAWGYRKREVLEELVDVMIMVHIVKSMCAIDADELWEMYKRKMKRNLDRL